MTNETPPTGCGAAAAPDETGLNRWPVNRAALRMLTEAGETHDPETPLHILTLALWAVKTGQTEAEADVVETIKAMTTWRPERIMNFLMLREDDEEYDPPGWQEAETPLELALVIIDDIEKKMVVHFPWYRSLNW